SDQMPAGSDAPESQIEFLVSEGFAEGSAVRALMAISRYTVGLVLEEQTALYNGCERVDQDLDFEFGIVAMVEGLASKRRGRLALWVSASVRSILSRSRSSSSAILTIGSSRRR